VDLTEQAGKLRVVDLSMLAHFGKVPLYYVACLVEILRRKNYLKVLDRKRTLPTSPPQCCLSLSLSISNCQIFNSKMKDFTEAVSLLRQNEEKGRLRFAQKILNQFPSEAFSCS
jgi:hypothetical protein